MRKKFFEARGSAPEEAEHAISMMRPLFRIEHEAKLRKIVTSDEHLAMRRERSKPIVDEIFRWVRIAASTVLPAVTPEVVGPSRHRPAIQREAVVRELVLLPEEGHSARTPAWLIGHVA